MAEPVNRSVSTTVSTMPSQDDPANFQWWADYHQGEADKIAGQEPGGSEAERLGQLQGEMDHRASAALFLARMEKEKDADYAAKAKEELAARGVLMPPPTSQEKAPVRDEIVEDTRAAFRDYGIPEEFAEHAVLVGQLDQTKDAADRERLYNNILDAKADLDEVARDNGESRTIEGVNDWRSVIDAAAVRTEDEARRTKSPEEIEEDESAADRKSWKEIIGNALKLNQGPSVAQKPAPDIRKGLAVAREHWGLTNQEARSKFPLLTTDREIEKVSKAGAWRAALIDKIPPQWQRRLGLDPERTYNNAVSKAYDRLIDKQRDSLLAERTKALTTLRGVDTSKPPHLLPSKQYRAAERLTQIDQQLRRLSPLDREQYGNAVQSAVAQKAPSVAVEQAVQAVQKVPAQAQVQPIERMPDQVPAQQMGPTKHEKALDSVRKLMAQTPVDGYRTKAADAMAKRIVQQLQQGRETLQLSTNYSGGDQGRANESHANAIEANRELIDAVRQNGIPVDTGRASVKKLEVEASEQVGQDLSQDSLL